ncbi:hypothetical protein niasHT_028206 [Heterodera trifolii]|uniref:E2 ubiquitin-conjugating enzyme n=1 Tax=Heterodera trifolii TaxID=157864 RepID=A0ABD2K913_9BILA
MSPHHNGQYGREKIEILQKSRKHKFLDNDNENESEHREPTDESNDRDDYFENENAIVNFELGKSQKGGICLWSEGFCFTHKKSKWWRCKVRDCPASVAIIDKSDNGMTGHLGQRDHNHLPEPQKQQAEIRRQKIRECVKAEPRIKPTRLLAEVRRSTVDETYVAMGSDNALSCMMRQHNYLRLSSSSLHCATTTTLQKRLHRRFSSSELTELKKEPITGFTAAPMDDGKDMFHWKATIKGPPESPYEGGTFHLDIVFRRDYPFTPPIVKFETPVYHPNVNKQGGICLDVLKATHWAPSFTISKVLLSISSLLCDPNPNSALRQDIANMYRDNREEYNRNAREWTKNHAMR